MWTSILKNDPRFSDRDKSLFVRTTESGLLTTFWLWNVFSIPTILNDRQNRHPEKWRSLHCCWFHQTKSREIVRIRLKLSESGQFISFKTGNFVGHFRTNRNDEIHESLNSPDSQKGQRFVLVRPWIALTKRSSRSSQSGHLSPRAFFAKIDVQRILVVTTIFFGLFLITKYLIRHCRNYPNVWMFCKCSP